MSQSSPLGSGSAAPRAQKPKPYGQNLYFAAAALVLGTATLTGAYTMAASQSDAHVMPVFGLSRIADVLAATFSIPNLGKWVLSFELGVIGLWLWFLAIYFVRGMAIPHPFQGHRCVFFLRQRWPARLSFVVFGVTAVTAGLLIAAYSDAAASILKSIWPLSGKHMVAQATEIAAVVTGGLIEVLGIQWLARFAWFVLIPSARIHIAVMLDSANHGFSNSVVLFGGPYNRHGIRTIRHDHLISATVRAKTLPRTLLDATTLQLLFVNGAQETVISEVPCPDSSAKAMAVNTFLNGDFKRAAHSRTLDYSPQTAAEITRGGQPQTNVVPMRKPKAN